MSIAFTRIGIYIPENGSHRFGVHFLDWGNSVGPINPCAIVTINYYSCSFTLKRIKDVTWKSRSAYSVFQINLKKIWRGKRQGPWLYGKLLFTAIFLLILENLFNPCALGWMLSPFYNLPNNMKDLQPNLLVCRGQTTICLNSLCRHVCGGRSLKYHEAGSNEALQNRFGLWTHFMW